MCVLRSLTPARPQWLLPVGGALVGYMTNWLALYLIFSPVNPTKFMGMTFQGLFLKRQPEVAEEFSAFSRPAC